MVTVAGHSINLQLLQFSTLHHGCILSSSRPLCHGFPLVSPPKKLMSETVTSKDSIFVLAPKGHSGTDCGGSTTEPCPSPPDYVFSFNTKVHVQLHAKSDDDQHGKSPLG